MSGPHKLSIRMYHVGFGDCFLLSFEYSTTERHLLIDFGTTRQSKDYMQKVAKDIAARCNGKGLDAVLVSHRHKDHLSGFATDNDPNKSSSGKIIASLNPKLVSMTWTEDPKLDIAAIRPDPSKQRHSFVSSLRSMQSIAEVAEQVELSARRRGGRSTELTDLSAINIANKSALTNLLNMAGSQDTEFLYSGSRTRLNSMFRGVRFHVLGPPTVEQWAKVKKQKSKDSAEYWHLANYWQLIESSFRQRDGSSPFSKRFLTRTPPEAMWLVNQMRDTSRSDLLRISRVMDQAINNTSVIMVIELWGTKLLFPGDAQIESWNYVLNGPDGKKNRELLSDVYVYKVGHHASLNGTPKSLWNLFTRRKDTSAGPNPLISLLSSRLRIHGNTSKGTEVPRSKLVKALDKGSELIDTPYDIDKRTKFEVVDFEDLEIEFV